MKKKVGNVLSLMYRLQAGSYRVSNLGQ
uniref:Uncharacterized protein n=1 Tax=Arundo donax TaxID=35708 RepID=A0A0A8YQX3_ARUDO